MKILLLSGGIPSKNNPQSGCFTMDQAIALKNAGHDVSIFAINGLIGREWKKPGLNHWKQEGVDCFELFGLPIGILSKLGLKKLGVRITEWASRKCFKKIVEKVGFPDIVHAHYLFTMVMGVAIKKYYPITLIGTEHWSRLAEPNLDRVTVYQAKRGYPGVDRLITVSKELRDCVKNKFGRESIVIHNLFNTSSLMPALAETGNKSYTITAVGSLIPLKGFDLLIKAFAKTKLVDRNVIINIYGKGPAKEFLENLIESHGLKGRVNLCGQKTKEEIYEALRHSDLFVLSSKQETFSVAIIEATGNGVPAVATQCGIVNEFDFKDVIKIPVDNIDAMRVALEEAYERRDSVDREAIQQQTIDNFSPEAIVVKLEKVYEEVLKEKR